MMNALIIECPKCRRNVGISLEDGDLVENETTEGFTTDCTACGCEFSFDVYVDVMNKTITNQQE